jgi:hypothetical protein
MFMSLPVVVVVVRGLAQAEGSGGAKAVMRTSSSSRRRPTDWQETRRLGGRTIAIVQQQQQAIVLGAELTPMKLCYRINGEVDVGEINCRCGVTKQQPITQARAVPVYIGAGGGRKT